MRTEPERCRAAMRAATVVRVTALIGLTLCSARARAESVHLDRRCLTIAFEVSGWGIGRVQGRFEDARGTLDIDRTDPAKSRLTVTASTQSIRTQSALFDSELRSALFFDAQRFPHVSFASSDIALLDPASGIVTGSLQMRGIARPIQLPFKLGSGLGQGAPAEPVPQLRATGTVRRSAWGMSALIPAISDDVKIDIQTGCTQ